MTYPLLFSFSSEDENDEVTLASFLVSPDIYSKIVAYATQHWQEDYHQSFGADVYQAISELDGLVCRFLSQLPQMHKLEKSYGVHDCTAYELQGQAVNVHMESYEVSKKFAELMNKWKELFESFCVQVSDIVFEQEVDIESQLQSRLAQLKNTYPQWFVAPQA